MVLRKERFVVNYILRDFSGLFLLMHVNVESSEIMH